MNKDQLSKLARIFTSEVHRNNFILNTGMMHVEKNLLKFNEYFDIDKCKNLNSWTEEEYNEFDQLIVSSVIERWIWPITLRAINGSMALGEERVNVTGSHLL
jgi:hypothetical protein